MVGIPCIQGRSTLGLVSEERTLAYNNLQALADENLIESIREHAHWQEGSECIEESGALFLAAVGRFPGPYPELYDPH